MPLMPVYEYQCPDCGTFEALRSMAQYQAPLACPVCAKSAQRILATAPALATLSASTRQAHSVNERSAHAPRSTADGGHRHGPGCGCGSAVAPSATQASVGGKKAFPSKRPWMISH